MKPVKRRNVFVENRNTGAQLHILEEHAEKYPHEFKVLLTVEEVEAVGLKAQRRKFIRQGLEAKGEVVDEETLDKSVEESITDTPVVSKSDDEELKMMLETGIVEERKGGWYVYEGKNYRKKDMISILNGSR